MGEYLGAILITIAVTVVAVVIARQLVNNDD